MASYLIPVTVEDGRPDVEYGENIVVTIDGVAHVCHCLGWNLNNPLSEDKQEWLIKTDMVHPNYQWQNYRAPIEQVQIAITWREAKLRGLSSGLHGLKSS